MKNIIRSILGLVRREVKVNNGNMDTDPQLDIIDILPQEWKDEHGNMSVMQSMYTCLFYNPSDFETSYLTGRIDEVYYLVLGIDQEVPYTYFTSHIGTINGQPQVEFIQNEGHTAKGPKTIFFTKCAEYSGISEIEAISRIEAARGLVNALEGMNATFVHEFTNVLRLPSAESIAVSPAQLMPTVFPAPFPYGNERIDRISMVLDQLDFPLRTKILLSLRWFDKSDREQDPIDSFLKSWFALEVLAMPDNSTNIKPINEILATIYGKSLQYTASYFQIGRIASLRADIVHNGAIRSIHQQLHKYTQAIFVDILLSLTNQPAERRAENILLDANFPPSSWQP